MEEFFFGLLKQIITWQTLFLAFVVMFLTEAIKKSTAKYLKLRMENAIEEKRIDMTAVNGGYSDDQIKKMEKLCKRRHDAMIDFIFSSVPILIGLAGAIWIDELYGGYSFGMRACYGILAGAGSSLLYRIVKYYLNKLKK